MCVHASALHTSLACYGTMSLFDHAFAPLDELKRRMLREHVLLNCLFHTCELRRCAPWSGTHHDCELHKCVLRTWSTGGLIRRWLHRWPFYLWSLGGSLTLSTGGLMHVWLHWWPFYL